MSLTNPNTPVSQQDLKDLYEQKILPYIGGAFGLVATGMDSANLYSTTERVVGQWIDGKPLYQKVININRDLASGQGYTLPLTDVDTILKHEFRMSWGNMASGVERMVSDSWFYGNDAVDIYSYNNSIIIRNTLAIGVFYVILEYTKTTDSAVESYGTDTTYSTDEHVVGSWIDGRPVYQKTFTGTSGANGADATFGSISNAETIVSLRGIVRNSNNMMHGAPNPGIYLKYYNGNIQTYTSDAQFGNQPCSITVQYTKSS